MKGRTQKTGTIRTREGVLPSGVKYKSTRGHFGTAQSSYATKRGGGGSKEVVRTRAMGHPKSTHGNTIVTKKGVTPGGRAYETTAQTGHSSAGEKLKKNTYTKVATDNKSSVYSPGGGSFEKTRGKYGTTKLKTAERTGSVKKVKKGPTKPRIGYGTN